MKKIVSPFFAWSLIVITAVVSAVLVYNDAKAYYADKIAQYNSEALASELETRVLIQPKIGTGLFIQGPQAE